jgi:hypothetical protein
VRDEAGVGLRLELDHSATCDSRLHFRPPHLHPPSAQGSTLDFDLNSWPSSRARFERGVECRSTLPLKVMVEITTSELPRPAWWQTHANLCGSSVLNLPPTASDYEIRDRYRQLSIQYHPDKQRDESAKEVASKQFLKIQKAYQGMSAFIPPSNAF